MTDKEKLDKLVTEIKKQRHLIYPKNTGEMRKCDTPSPLEQGWLNALKWMEGLIDSMQKEAKNEAKIKVEQIMAEVDAKFHCKSHWKSGIDPSTWKEVGVAYDPQQLIAFARHFAEWQKHRMIEQSCYYIRANMAILDVKNNDCMPEWLDKYKKAMEE